MISNRLSSWLVISIVSVGAAHAQEPAERAELVGRIAALEQRVERAESLRAIKRLQYAYGHYVEFGLWHDFADLFADAAVAHYPAGDLGREAIRELFLEQVGQGRLGLADGRLYPHFVLQPVVTLDPGGRTAHGRWHVLSLLGGLGGNATWVGGLYENDYVVENGVWKIAELRTNTQFSGSYAGGWTNPPRTAPAGDLCENYLVNDCTIAFHYDADRAGAPLALSSTAVSPDSGVESIDLNVLSARVQALDRRIVRLLDESAVRNLQHAYGYYVDRKLWDDVADLFAADATFELGLRGVYRGQSSIRRMLAQFGGPGIEAGELDDHLQLETIVTVAPDGRTARARGIDFALWGSEAGDGFRSEWREAAFENVYVKDAGVWKITAVHLYPRFATDYALGWAEDARPAPVASAEFAPDAPPTVIHGVYPAFYAPPFHFTNPVTGAAPQYPEGIPAPEARDLGVAEASTAAAAAVRPAEGSGGPSVALTARLDESERRLDVAIAHDAVENLANAYNYALDELDRGAARDLFVADRAITVSNTGVAGDRPQILAAIDTVRFSETEGRPQGFFAIHQTLQPVIHVAPDGLTARIRFRLFEQTGQIGEEGAWIGGVYEAEAVADGDVWKLDRLSINYTWAAEYTSGWAGAAPYAEIGATPFHYDNPVSGRARPGQAER